MDTRLSFCYHTITHILHIYCTSIANIFQSATNSITNEVPLNTTHNNNNNILEFPIKRKNIITKDFTFNLRSSHFSDDYLPKSQISNVSDINLHYLRKRIFLKFGGNENNKN